MKKTILFFAVLMTLKLQAQYYPLSDTNFRNWIKSYYQTINPAIISGNNLDTTIARTSGPLRFKLVNNSVIQNLDGLQFFYLSYFELRNTKVNHIPNTLFGPSSAANSFDTFLIINNDSLLKINLVLNDYKANLAPPTTQIKNNNNLSEIDTFKIGIANLLNANYPQLRLNPKLKIIHFIDCGMPTIDSNIVLDSILKIGNNFTLGITIKNNTLLKYVGPIKISGDNTEMVNIWSNPELNYIGNLDGYFQPPYGSDYMFGVQIKSNPKLTSLNKMPRAAERFFIIDLIGLKKINSLPRRVGSEVTLQDLPALDSILTSIPDSVGDLAITNVNLKLIGNFPSFVNTILVNNCSNLLPTGGLPPLPAFKKTVNIEFQLLNTNYMEPLVAQTKMVNINLVNMTYLKCLPVLFNNYNFSFDTNVIKCFPNYVASTPSLGLPLCSAYNPNNCGVYDNISGNIFNEKNSNCSKDVNEVNAYQIPVLLFKKSSLIQKVWSNVNGMYSFKTNAFDTFTIRIDTTGLPFNVICPASSFYTAIITPADSVKVNQNFGIACKYPGSFDIGADYLTKSTMFPGGKFHVWFNAGDLSSLVNNIKCYTSSLAGSVSFSWNGPVRYDSTHAPAQPDSVFTNRVVYNVSNFSTFSQAFDIRFKVDTAAKMNDTVNFTLTVNPIAGDIKPSNNSITRMGLVGNSLDPNKKEVSPEGNLNIDNLPSELVYTVHFQNTGNAPARNIYITDNIDSKLDFNSIRFLGFSHAAAPTLYYESGKMRVDFKDIMLPDSVHNEPASHGWFQYAIKIKPGIQINDEISNSASIYFDFNSPIVTNTVKSKVVKLTNTSTIGASQPTIFKLYPNPSDGNIHCSSFEKIDRLVVTDIRGKEILELKNPESFCQFTIPIKGVFFVTSYIHGMMQTQKLVVE